MTRTANQIGDEYERLAARLLHGVRVKASGAGRFLKSDVADCGRRVWSIKGTDNDRLTITQAMLTDARRAATGMHGRGDGSRWGMVLGLGGKCYALIELEDYVESQQTAPQAPLPSSKSERRRAALRRR